MDDSNNSIAQETIERENMKREGLNAHIQSVSEELLRKESWEEFKPDEIAEASLQVATMNTNSSDEDEQTRRFQQFISIATNFSSLPFAQRLLKIPDLVENIKQLIENMIKEIQEYSDMANELHDLIECFVRMVMQAKHSVNMMLPLLKETTTQMGIVQDVLKPDPSNALSDTDKKDIRLALDQMSSGINQLLNLSKSAVIESRQLDDHVHNMTNSVQSKKVTVEERLEIANFCLRYATGASSLASGAAAGGFVVAEAFGGVGALVIAGTAFPPVTAIIGAAILGGIGAKTATIMVQKFWVRHQLKALGYLEKIFESLIELKSANRCFMCRMADTEEKANAVSVHIQGIQLCLESERQRRAHHDVCNVAIGSTTAMIESLERISNLDISKWTDTSHIISSPTPIMLTYVVKDT
ncbi:unnamed protein product [Adineta ricciae]|uniref:Uncharacterized protein n=1 Tax=Adineta ricciae TaxID=249248 RepID=A0A814BHR5_ADIRI|nr:unnamed protein product [Adineta ricciae]CAF1282976.1 unnamed protein product [Adineta ricciae]